MLETTEEFIGDCERLIDTYHQHEPLAMRQIVVAPCQPVNCYRDTFVESIRLARDRKVYLHSHVGEGESAVMQARTAGARWIIARTWVLSGRTSSTPIAGN